VNAATWQVLRCATRTVRQSKLSHAFSAFAGGLLAFAALNSGPLLESQLLIWSMGIVSILLLAGMSSGIGTQNHPRMARHLPDHPCALLSAMRWISLPPMALALAAFTLWMPDDLLLDPSAYLIGTATGVAALTSVLLWQGLTPRQSVCSWPMGSAVTQPATVGWAHPTRLKESP
jgi:hypothetical protein